LCGGHAVKNGKQMRCDEKEKARPDLAGGPIVSGPEINGGRESWSLHRRVNFRHLHCCVGSRRRCFRDFHHPRHRASSRRHYSCHHLHGSLRHRYSRRWAQSRNVKAPDSCGSVRNKFAAPSTRARTADCKSAAANSCGYYCWKACCYRSAAAAANCRGCRNSARFARALRRLRTNARCSKSLAIAVVAWRRRPRGRAIDCSRLRIPSRPRRTIRVIHARCLRWRARGRFEFPKPAGARPRSVCISLRFPGTLAIAGALRRTIPHDRSGRAFELVIAEGGRFCERSR